MPVLAMTKLRNRITALSPDVIVSLKNIRINGELRGCSGFVSDPVTNSVVYINTESSYGHAREALYRTAKHTRDFTGGRNRFATHDDLPTAVLALLKASAARTTSVKEGAAA